MHCIVLFILGRHPWAAALLHKIIYNFIYNLYKIAALLHKIIYYVHYIILGRHPRAAALLHRARGRSPAPAGDIMCT